MKGKEHEKNLNVLADSTDAGDYADADLAGSPGQHAGFG